MRVIGLMGNGPIDSIPELRPFIDEVDLWIGVDRGALTLIEHEVTVSYAIGDFDSMDSKQRKIVKDRSIYYQAYPVEKNETDLEIALQKALDLTPQKIYMFGVTGGRLDHALINMQLLHTVIDQNIRGIIVDRWNQLELTKPGTHSVSHSKKYPYISFVPFMKRVKNLSLSNFYYPLEGYDLSLGSTRCISNKLINKNGTFSYDEGMLLLIKSRDINA